MTEFKAWSRRCTRRTSRSSSTWSTTTPPRATSSARRSPSAASTTRRTTGWSTRTRPHYYDTTGTGNSLLMRHPHVLQLIMDSLRYWVTEMHVDGFRFDLAATLARQFHEVDRLSAFFDLVQQDPVVSQVKLIAEPWDVGDGGYQVGNFPPLWTEWNGKYRDTVRDFWRGEPATLGEFASRLTGSSDLYDALGPQADRVDQLRHRPRRLHPARPGVLQREAQRGQRRGQQRRREPQPLVELRRRGRDRRPGDPRAAAASAAQLAHHAAAQPGRADARPRRRGRPHPARQQQRLLPGQRAVVGGLGARRRAAGAAGVHRGPDRAAPQPPGVPAPPVLRRRPGPRRPERARRHRVVLARRHRDGRGGLAQRLRAQPDGLPQRRGHPRARPARPADRR